MLIVIPDLLSQSDVKSLRDGLAEATFVDGRETASGKAKDIKNNLQTSGKDARVELLRRVVAEAMMKSSLLQISCHPKVISTIFFSKYEPGMAYGSHVDNPLMGGVRNDISFTLFLSDPDSYEGGELVIESPAGEQPIKLPAGAMIIYPATSLHHVAEVTKGERLASVGWMRSYIRDPARRELLFDLETARRALRNKPDTESEATLLMKSVSNLMRMWTDD